MRKIVSPAFVAALTAFAAAALTLVFPAEALTAALKGVAIWWDVLFPALFPFVVISELMLGVGLVHFLGMLLDPLMRPLFRVPGIGGFVLAMGFAASYPVGARLTAQLWDQGLINREEGERLVSFTTSSDPIFLIGAVAVGFFHDPGLAVVLAAAHYGSALLVGLLMRFHGVKPRAAVKQEATPVPTAAQAYKSSLLRRAFEAMHEARLKDGRPLGLMLQQAVGNAIQIVFVVGGLVVFFSVVMEVLSSAHIMGYFHIIIDSILRLFGVPVELSQAVANGFFEVTLGSKTAGGAAGSPLMYKVAIAAWVLSWAGLSVHAQIVSLLQRTNLRYLPFAAARFIHGLLAASLVFLLWEPLAPVQSTLAPLLPEPDVTRPLTTFIRYTLPAAGWTFTLMAGLLLLASALYLIGRRCMKAIRS